MRLTVLTILAFLPAAAGAMDFAEPDPATLAAVEDYMGGPIADARSAGAFVNIVAARADVDGDGVEDTFAKVESGYLCGGGGGCPVVIFRQEPGGLVPITTVFTDFVDLADGKSKGMRDLVLTSQAGPVTVRWNGSEYAN